MPPKKRLSRKELPFNNFEEFVARRNILEFYELNKDIPALCKFVLIIKEIEFQGRKETFQKKKN
jgi:hypothetical protein